MPKMMVRSKGRGGEYPEISELDFLFLTFFEFSPAAFGNLPSSSLPFFFFFPPLMISLYRGISFDLLRGSPQIPLVRKPLVTSCFMSAFSASINHRDSFYYIPNHAPHTRIAIIVQTIYIYDHANQIRQQTHLKSRIVALK